MNPGAVVEGAGEGLERGLAHWSALPLITLAVFLGLLGSVDVTNFVMSYVTLGLLVLTVSRDRRDRKALHAKLDDLEMAIPEADSGKARLEDQPEEMIEAVRG